MLKKESLKRGLPPGTIIHIGKERLFNPIVKFISYDNDTYEEKIYENYKTFEFLNEIKNLIKPNKVCWINVLGVHDTELVKTFGEIFNIHSMLLEDISSTFQRPYLDTHEGTISLQIKNIVFDPLNLSESSEQISLLMAKNCVFSFQENSDDSLIKIKERILNSSGSIRSNDSKYLFYALFDIIVDNYFQTIEDTSEQIDIIEEEVLLDPDNATLQKIYKLKKTILSYRKSIVPLREVLSKILRNEDKLFDDSIMIYIHDLYNHIITIIDNIESYRDILSNLLDLYLSKNGSKINEIMKTLTVVSTIFIPLGFITGLYGMNFEKMPELKYSFAYPFGFWGITLIMTLSMLYYFRKKKWM